MILREIIPDDAEGMYELDSDPQVHRYLGNKTIDSRDKAMDVIRMVRKQYHENGIGRWAMVEKRTGAFIGWTGLKLVKETTNNHINYHDLGYRLIRKYWGQGFASEGANASLAYGFSELKLNEIFAAAHTENLASNRILQKLGFRQSGSFLYDTSTHHWYSLGKEVWEQTRSQSSHSQF